MATLTISTLAATITNGGFESGLAGWRPLWTREAKAGSLAVDRETAHSGKSSARIEHRGEKDWSLEPARRVSVQPGDVYSRGSSYPKASRKFNRVSLATARLRYGRTIFHWRRKRV